MAQQQREQRGQTPLKLHSIRLKSNLVASKPLQRRFFLPHERFVHAIAVNIVKKSPGAKAHGIQRYSYSSSTRHSPPPALLSLPFQTIRFIREKLHAKSAQPRARTPYASRIDGSFSMGGRCVFHDSKLPGWNTDTPQCTIQPLFDRRFDLAVSRKPIRLRFGDTEAGEFSTLLKIELLRAFSRVAFLSENIGPLCSCASGRSTKIRTVCVWAEVFKHFFFERGIINIWLILNI